MDIMEKAIQLSSRNHGYNTWPFKLCNGYGKDIHTQPLPSQSHII